MVRFRVFGVAQLDPAIWGRRRLGEEYEPLPNPTKMVRVSDRLVVIRLQPECHRQATKIEESANNTQAKSSQNDRELQARRHTSTCKGPGTRKASTFRTPRKTLDCSQSCWPGSRPTDAKTPPPAHANRVFSLPPSPPYPLSSVRYPLSSVLCPLSSVLCPLSSGLHPLSSILYLEVHGTDFGCQFMGWAALPDPLLNDPRRTADTP